MRKAVRKEALGRALESLLDERAMRARVPHDPVQFPRRFFEAAGASQADRAADAELAALLSACLAYGRVGCFVPVLERLFALLGPHPARAAREFDAPRDSAQFRGLVYRFNVGADFASLVAGAGALLRRDGSLGAHVARSYLRGRAAGEGERPALQRALAGLVDDLRAAVPAAVAERLGPPRAFGHLLPDPRRGGACKRLMLFLRWMIRGGPRDPIDLGLWREVPASALVVPLDTHLARVSRCLGLTRRRDASWRTACEITDALARFDAADPVKYDFALCHFGMSGGCPSRPSARACTGCVLTRVAER